MQHRSPEQVFQDAIRTAARTALDVEPERVPLTYPPTAAQGDLASPVCFELARVARRAPRAIAESIVAAIGEPPGFARVEVAGGGYINAFFDRTAVLRGALVADRGAPWDDRVETGKIVVEHTNINPNKAAHIGHLRNAVLGDTLVRFLRQIGDDVEVQNYIDDTGVQVVDLVVGFLRIREEDLVAVRTRYAPEALRERGERFDVIAWDLYAEVTRYYEEDPERRRFREQAVHDIERGGNPVAELADHVAMRMVSHHLTTMDRLGVRYDVLPRESDILGLRFWDDAFERLKRGGAIHRVEDGKNAGCFVMDLEGADAGAGEDQKVIVRSNGSVTYVGKDIAYQMWKFGLLGRDFRYRTFPWPGTEPLYDVWSTSHAEGVDDHPPFGAARRVYNVIDVRQSYLQRVVAQGLRSLGHDAEAERSIHFDYEMVALTPASVEAMFPDYPLTDEDRARAYLEMSGRRGLGVRADDLIDTLIERARAEVVKRNPDADADRTEETARRIAVGALRYYMLRFTKNRVVAFDLDAALAFEGETGPYIQYSVVRAKNILGKIGERFGEAAVDAGALGRTVDLDALPEADRADHWTLASLVGRVPAVVRQAVDGLEFAVAAKHAYVLAQTFNSFYHRWPVAQESDPGVREVRTALVRLYHDGMSELLGLMGIEVPDRM